MSISLPITWRPVLDKIDGADADYLGSWAPKYDVLRRIERASIRAFIEERRALLCGIVLDFGAGDGPYRDLCAPEALYIPVNRGELIPNKPPTFDAILCTQVLQYCEHPVLTLSALANVSHGGTYLLLTYPTSWPSLNSNESEGSDLWRFTRDGMAALLDTAGWIPADHVERAAVIVSGNRFSLGGGVVAKRKPKKLLPGVLPSLTL